MLAVLNKPDELAGHIRGAIAYGLTKTEIRECLLHWPCTRDARRCRPRRPPTRCSRSSPTDVVELPAMTGHDGRIHRPPQEGPGHGLQHPKHAWVVDRIARTRV